MWVLGIGFSLMFFLLKDANRLWAQAEGPSVLTLYATPWIWFFLPFFSALAIPWPLTVWYLRRIGRKDEADSIADAADLRSGMDTFRVMKWLGITSLASLIASFTMLAIPVHLSDWGPEARLGHYVTNAYVSGFPSVRRGARLSSTDTAFGMVAFVAARISSSILSMVVDFAAMRLETAVQMLRKMSFNFYWLRQG